MYLMSIGKNTQVKAKKATVEVKKCDTCNKELDFDFSGTLFCGECLADSIGLGSVGETVDSNGKDSKYLIWICI